MQVIQYLFIFSRLQLVETILYLKACNVLKLFLNLFILTKCLFIHECVQTSQRALFYSFGPIKCWFASIAIHLMLYLYRIQMNGCISTSQSRFLKTKNLNCVREKQVKVKNHQFVFRRHARPTCDSAFDVEAAALRSRCSDFAIMAAARLRPPACHSGAGENGSVQQSEWEGEKAEATPTTVSGAMVERAAARLVQQVRLMIAFFFFLYCCYNCKVQRRSDR